MIADVINLDRAPERWSSMTRLATTRGLAVRRVAAVDGRDPAALAGAVAAPDAGLSPAEIACFESHRLAWRRVAAGDEPFGLILEDDVFPPGSAEVDAIVSAANGFDILKLNAHPRGLLVHVLPVATEDGRMLLRVVQGSSDSSAYLISRGFAARALEIHRGYRQALDLALFDPATGVVVGQVDPGLTIQQRYADFRFLDEGARKSDIQAPSRMRRRRRPLEAVVREGKRVWRRRIVPALQPLLNLARPAAERIVFRRIAFRA